MVPEELRYTAEHEWVQEREAGTIRFGITDYAQNALGDIVFISLPAVGTSLRAGDPCGEVESTKSVSDLYAPVSGEVVAVNSALDAEPEIVNGEPYGAGWMVEVAASDSAEWDSLMSAGDYEALVATK